MAKLNILVEGSRGKSGTVEMLVRAFEALNYKAVGKITGKDTLLIHNGGFETIPREKGGFLIDQENKPIVQKFSHYDFTIFENQALSCYTMRVVHNIVKPLIIVIPNIRYEHQDRLGETIEEMATSFALNFKGAKFVVTTESKKVVLDIFRKHCRKYGVVLDVINKEEEVPSIQSLYLTRRVIQIATGKDMPKALYSQYHEQICNRIEVKSSATHNIDYFLGAKVNDVESTVNVFNYLTQRTDKKFCFLCYFRKDRVERTEAFREFFKKYLDHERIEKFYFAGHVIDRPRHKKVEILPEKHKQKIFDHCRKNGLILFTAINGVNDFMRGIEADLTS
jgi:gamma-polyglutamate synthase